MPVVMGIPGIVVPPKIIEPPAVGVPGQAVVAPHVFAPVPVLKVMVIIRAAQMIREIYVDIGISLLAVPVPILVGVLRIGVFGRDFRRPGSGLTGWSGDDCST
ncbi:hypothetical protein ACFL6Q_07205 [Candidatus Neomarinimicrobiota bacterium]